MIEDPRARVAQLLQRLGEGDQAVGHELLPLVYDELRQLAAQVFASQQRGHTLQATALVHEAYLKLLGNEGRGTPWAGQRHFFSVAATAMRQVLMDYARGARRIKRGEGAQRVTLDLGAIHEPQADPDSGREVDLIDLSDALDDLESAAPRIARVVELRYLCGLTVEEVAAEMQLTERTVFKDWRAGRAMLRRRLVGEP